MVFNPYPFEESVFVTANTSGIAYGVIKGCALVMIGIALYEAPSLHPLAIAGLTATIGLAILAATITAAQEKKAEQRYEEMRRLRPNEVVNEQLVKANLIAMWTCYSLAAHLYGKPTARLACQDMKILAIKITKIVAGIGGGLLVRWFGVLMQSTAEDISWNWKATLGVSLLASTGIAFLAMYMNDTLPKIMNQSRVLLEDAVENCPRQVVVVDPNVQELQPLRLSAQAVR
ncbi:MAG: hypothetical protein LLG04_13670 [Parachlamydia sp.]|nr:hypothetical protein [Parachlamydia sp.]